MNQPDFLRHIASKILTPTVITDQKKLDEARMLLAKAESVYKFSSYNGNPKRISDYLLSPDFTELVFIIGIDVTKKLLKMIIESYTDPDIIDAAKKIYEELNGFEETAKEEEIKKS